MTLMEDGAAVARLRVRVLLLFQIQTIHGDLINIRTLCPRDVVVWRGWMMHVRFLSWNGLGCRPLRIHIIGIHIAYFAIIWN